MRLSRLAIALLMAILTLPAFGQMTLDRPLQAPQPLLRDSGLLANPTATLRTLHTETVTLPGAAWMRLYFGDAMQLSEGSMLRMTSARDGEVQELDATALRRWSNSSAYFNGDTVTVELVAGPRSVRNRLVIEQAAFETAVASPAGSCGICGADDRIPSSEDFSARLLPAGCSALVWNTDSCMVSAGHCVTGGMVMQFRVPPSAANCNTINPPVADQFPVDTFQFTNGGVGNDWSVMTMGTNNLGEKPYDRYGSLRPLAGSIPGTGAPVDIWGFGIDDECTRNQVQQHSVGSLTAVGGSFLNHNADATFGNSGSSILSADQVIGIVTHCPCPNWATRIDFGPFVTARDNLCPTAPEFQFPLLTGLNVIIGAATGGGLAEIQDSDDNYATVDSVPQAIRQNTLTEINAVSPLTDVSRLDLRVEVDGATLAPVFLGIQLFDYDAGAFRGIDFTVVSTGGDWIRDLTEIPDANRYIDGSGNIRVRVYETARASDIPGGFTKGIDHVEISVLP